VAFKSLINRNRTSYMSELIRNDDHRDAGADEVKLKLPFIVVNTSKETVIDCWLSADRFSLYVSVAVSVSLFLRLKICVYLVNNLAVHSLEVRTNRGHAPRMSLSGGQHFKEDKNVLGLYRVFAYMNNALQLPISVHQRCL